MNKSIDYTVLVDEAMHIIVYKALKMFADHDGKIGDHHFFISFLTRYPGVILPENLLEIYPKEMMVVLQHRFYDLEVNEKHFSVSLSFNGSVKRLVIPFASIVTFTDPSTQFGLQFKDMNLEVKDIASGKHDHTLESTPIVKSSKKSVKKGVIEDHKIVSLEQFKKKKYKA